MLAAAGCTGTYDAGKNSPHGLLPVDERNPIVLVNDSEYENWQGEYALLLANGGGLKLKVTPDAPGWLVRKCDSAAATERFWELLHDSATFSPPP